MILKELIRGHLLLIEYMLSAKSVVNFLQRGLCKINDTVIILRTEWGNKFEATTRFAPSHQIPRYFERNFRAALAVV
jgi:hypothetical protein